MPKLYMLLIGCSPKGRNIEQHDIFFGIGNSIRDVMEDAIVFWPEAKNTFHLDAWREVTQIDGFNIKIVPAIENNQKINQLFFINLGGYKPGEFEEFHYKMLIVAKDKNEALKLSKQTAFFKHTGFKNATAHIDDKYGVDVDDIFLVKDILPKSVLKHHTVLIEKANEDDAVADLIHLGYFRPDQIDKWSNE